MAKGNRKKNDEDKPECFVIMPISDPDGYSNGHFKRVYEDIFRPACQKAGFRAIRADDVRASNLIHLEILQQLLKAPMAICDLSSRNHNVLFELGLRQAFDKPVTLVQEQGTPSVFDIAPLRHVEYRRARLYDEVHVDQENIAEAIKETYSDFDQKKGVNSLVKLLALSQPASLPEVKPEETNPTLQLIRAEIGELRRELQLSKRSSRIRLGAPTPAPAEQILEVLAANGGHMQLGEIAAQTKQPVVNVNMALADLYNQGLVFRRTDARGISTYRSIDVASRADRDLE